MSGKASIKGKRKLTDVSDGLSSPKKSSLRTQSNTMSPASSPLKGPLIEDVTESGSPSFAAKCFYGFKSSSSVRTKENYSTPKKNNVRQTKQLSSEPNLRILQDTHLNEKLLDRIAASPIKQAVLQRCSVEEFRKLYRDEIKEIEQEEQLAERRITRKLSKIVWKRNDSEDNWGSSDDGIQFKISNRGFDVDSISNGSSSIRSQDVISPVKTDNSNLSVDSGEKGNTSNSQDATSDRIQKTPIKTPPSAGTTSERKFFKSKSVGKSAGTSSVLLSKGFNLRFVRQSNSCGVKKKKGKNKTSLTPKSNSHKKTAFADKLRLSYEDSLGSTVLTASSQGSTANETTPNQSRISKVKENEKYTGDDFDDDVDDCAMDLVVMKGDNFKTFELVSPKRQRLNYSRKSESPHSLSDVSPNDQDKSDNEDNMKQDAKDVASNCIEQDNDAESPSSKKLFPIFTTRKTSRLAAESLASVKSGRFGTKAGKDDQSQLIIDAGQKKFGATQCNVCGMVYCQADPTDETSHAKFHKRLLEVLKFSGWKKERVVQENPLDCGRIILILSDDPKSHRKKVEEIYEVMGRELGFPGDTAFTNPYQKVFLYISIDKEIEGCCVAEPIKEGNRVIPGDMDSNDASGRRPWCCEKVPEPALIGISRLWVAAQSRRSGVASRLMEAVQQWFDYGSLIPKDKIAFSDPTPDGRRFAHKFIGTPTFLVYKYKFN